MSTQNFDAIKGLYAAFAIGDMPNVLAVLHDDIIWNEAENFPYADNNPYIGPQAVLEGVFARCGGEWDGFATFTMQASTLLRQAGMKELINKVERR